MNCGTNDINLSDKLKVSVFDVAQGNIDLANVVTSFLLDPAFRQFVSENEELEGRTFDVNSNSIEDFANIHQNKLRKYLRAYYKKTYRAVENSMTKLGNGRLMGFSSMAAKQTAKRHTGDIIKKIYKRESTKVNKLSGPEIIKEVNEIILGTYYDEVDKFVEDIINNPSEYSKAAQDKAEEYKKVLNSLRDLARRNKADIEQRDKLESDISVLSNQARDAHKAYTEFKAKKDVQNANNAGRQALSYQNQAKQLREQLNELNTRIKSRNEKNTKDTRDRLLCADFLVMNFAKEAKDLRKVTLPNWFNLNLQARANANEWYFLVFNSKDMTSLLKDYGKVGDLDEYLENEEDNDDEIVSKYNGESIDETTKSWEDSIYKTLNQTVNARIRLSLSEIPKLTSPFNPSSEQQALDTANELGVSTYMNAQYLINQIFAKTETPNRETFITTLEEAANSSPELYGLGQIVYEMKRNPVFLNEMFAAFSKPKIKKTILTIRDIADKEGIEFDYSNRGSEPVTALVYTMLNKLRANYINAYNIDDAEVLKNAANNVDTEGVDKLKLAVRNTMTKYFPGLKTSIYDELFGSKNPDATKNLLSFAGHLTTIIESVGKMKKELNEKSNAAYATWQNEMATWRKDKVGEAPKRTYVSQWSIKINPAIYKSLINMSKTVNKYIESPARLQSNNAEGHSSSDISKNSYVTRFDEAMSSNIETLGRYFTQGEDESHINQYHYNPLLFGLRDLNGNLLRDKDGRPINMGMFNTTQGGLSVNPNAKDMLKISLFDGTKNIQDNSGKTYSSMSKIDFFISQFFAFKRAAQEMTDTGMSTTVNGRDMANYAMRIGSDAPKIFFTRAQKYTDQQIAYALYNNLLNEITILTKSLNSVFTQDGDNRFVLKSDTHGLIDRIHYNKNLVKEVEVNGKKRYILSGNAFKFDRLFNIGDYSVSDKLLSILSLYGEGGFVSGVENGNLEIDITAENNSPFKVADGEIIFSPDGNIKQQLFAVVNDWINHYKDDAKVRVQEYISTLKEQGIKVEEDEIINYLLNSVNMDIMYDDLYEGDFKYYNGARDSLKRMKESQAGGESYSAYDIENEYLNDVHNMMYNNQQEEVGFYNVDDTGNMKFTPLMAGANPYSVKTFEGKKKHRMIARNGFRGVTIYNTVTPIDGAMQMKENLKAGYIAQGINPETADRMAGEIASGFAAPTKINDAQSYITLDEFIRRRYADGTLRDYKDLIEQLLDPNIKAEDIDLSEINARIQVQKNFYFDKVFDAETGLYYPRQIKNAEFVLIPKLLPENSELRRVHDWMVKNDIGQLNTAETSKAAKKNIFTIWDRKNGSLVEDFDSLPVEGFVENYQYRYLYKQQDVPEHMNDAKNKAGIQIMKKIIDNIYNEIDSEGRENLKEYAESYQRAFSANIKEDFYNFVNMVGWQYDEKTGKLTNNDKISNSENLDFHEFYARAREEAARLGMDSNFIEYLLPTENGIPTMPNWMNTVSNKLESIANSMFNGRITRQTLPGWHAAQITGVGYSKKLNFDVEKGEMEVYLPRWSKLIPKDYPIEKLETEGLTIQLGYRIPTEGKQSISVLKVVGFVDECFGSTIVVPDAWVTQTGSDFDVDSVYGISWEMTTTTKKGKKVIKKVPYTPETINDEDLYTRYVKSRLDSTISKNSIGEDVQNGIQEIKDRLNNISERAEQSAEYDALDKKRNETFENLPDKVQAEIKRINHEQPRIEKTDKKTNTTRKVIDITQSYPIIMDSLNNMIEKNRIATEEVPIIQEYIEYMQGLLDIIEIQKGIPSFDYEEFKEEKNALVEELKAKAKQAYFEAHEQAAKELGLLSFDDFKALPFEEKLDRKGRNNLIIDRMIKIMQDPSSREEQYGRSNFDDISSTDFETGAPVGANNIIDAITGDDKKKQSRSPYNPLDQLDYFDDVMAGARLKALSVNWDTFASKLNKVRAFLDDSVAIDVVLHMGDLSAEGSRITYDEDIIRTAYKEDIEAIDGETNGIQTEYAPEDLTVKHPEALEKFGIKLPHVAKSEQDAVKLVVKRPGKITEDSESVYSQQDIVRLTQAAIKYRNGIESLIKNNDNSKWRVYSYSVVRDMNNPVDDGWKLLTCIRNAYSNQGLNIIPDIYANDPRYKNQVVLDDYTYNFLKEVHSINPNFWTDINEFIYENADELDDKYMGAIDDNAYGDFYGPAMFYEPRIIIDAIGRMLENSVDIVDTRQTVIPFDSKQTDTIKMKARRIGWSRSNRNIVGKLVTPYASQTTAHHLDAVKEGSIPNVNEYTFNVYKLMSTLGLDYETIIGFMRQPAITEIVKVDNVINSIFFKSNDNQTEKAIVNIVANAGLRDEKGENIKRDSNFHEAIKAALRNDTIRKELERIFNISLDIHAAISDVNEKHSGYTPDQIERTAYFNLGRKLMQGKMALDKQELFKRLKATNPTVGGVYTDALSPVAFDLAVAITFANIKRGAGKIDNFINLVAADKFGAKQSLRETRQVIDKVNKYRDDLTISKDGVSFLNLFYPLDAHGNIDVAKSTYPSIAHVYKYATQMSYDINKLLFETENDDFARAEKELSARLGRNLTEAEYKEYKKYAISTLYNFVPQLMSPLTLDERGRIMIDEEQKQKNATELNSATKYWDAERSRIFGYGVDTTGDFDISSNEDFTEEEFKQFLKLTPAQKVLFIQNHFGEDAGIFKYLNPTLYNEFDITKKGVSRQYVNYTDQIDDVEDLIFEFEKAFFNHNRLIKAAALDLIKYAFVAEGFNFKTGYISKIVPNSALYKSVEDGGMDIIDGKNGLREQIKSLPDYIRSGEFLDLYARSHSQVINTYNLPGWTKSKSGNKSTYFRNRFMSSGAAHIDATINNNQVEGLVKDLHLFQNNGGYIKVHFPLNESRSTTQVFKVRGISPIVETKDDISEVVGYMDYMLIPVNTLDSNETYDTSYNSKNNKVASLAWYNAKIDTFESTMNYMREVARITPSEQTKANLKQSMSDGFEAVGGYSPVEGFYINDEHCISDIAENAEQYFAASAKHLMDEVVADYNANPEKTVSFIQYNPFPKLNLLLPRGKETTQEFITKDGPVKFKIQHLKIKEKQVNQLNEWFRQENPDAKEYSKAVAEMKKHECNASNAQLYKVSKDVTPKRHARTNALLATTPMMPSASTSTGVRPSVRRSPIDAVTENMLNEIHYAALKREVKSAKQFESKVRRAGINTYYEDELVANRSNIYTYAATYYQSAANHILNQLEHTPEENNGFFMGGVYYSIDDPQLYEDLADHEEDYVRLAELILDGITFGNRVADLFGIDLTAEDEVTKKAVEGIIYNINRVKSNNRLKVALSNMFNIYFKKYSTNPEVTNGLLELRETFGDIDAIDAWITDPAEIQNPEVQVILKKVYQLLNHAEMFDARDAKKAYEKRVKEIEASGPIDYNKIIDNEHGRLRQDFEQSFLDERKRLNDALNEAYITRLNDEDGSSTHFEKYIRAKLARDKFMFENTHQNLVDEYYAADIALREAVIDGAGDLYFEFAKYQNELWNTKDDDLLSPTELARKEAIKNKIADLRNPNYPDGSEKPFRLKKAANAINRFIELQKKLNEKYFVRQPYEGFKEDYIQYKRYVRDYDARNGHKTLAEKLSDIGYREAYNWLRKNGVEKPSTELSAKLQKAFKTLSGRVKPVSSKRYEALKALPGVVDETGLVDASKLTDDQLAIFRDEDMTALAHNYDNGYGEGILIKIIPNNLPLGKFAPKSEEDKKLFADLAYKDNAKKFEIIGKINDILKKVIDTQTGKFMFDDFFNDAIVTNEEREQLSLLYQQLRDLRSDEFKKYKKRKNHVYEDMTSPEYGVHYTEYRKMTNPTHKRQFENIFMELDETGKLVANSYIYGYKVPTSEYIDVDKMEARDFVKNNVEFKPNIYYERAAEEAMSHGIDHYNEWFMKNHVYNPYTHVYEPLKIWTTMNIIPGSEMGNSVTYTPSAANSERTIADGMTNSNFKPLHYNYRTERKNVDYVVEDSEGEVITAGRSNVGGRYNSSISLNSAEKDMRDLMIETLEKNARTYSGKRFVAQGYLPRDRATIVNAAYVGTQALNALGASWHSGSDSNAFAENRDYTHDRDVEESMLGFIKGTGTRDYEHIPRQDIGESDADYARRVATKRRENEEIQKSNEAIDNALLNRNWHEVMQQYVYNSAITRAKTDMKPYLYLVLEDLRQNRAYKLKGHWNRKVINRNGRGTSSAVTEEMNNTYGLIENFTKRIIFDEFHKNSKLRTTANFLQNLASAKYMIFNLYGGIANVTTGETNIAMETIAKEYFDGDDYGAAKLQYLRNVGDIISTMYSEKSNNLTAALIKRFEVVDFDQVLQFGAGSEGLGENLKRVRNWMYGMQSGGEHVMQNSVLLAMLKSHRVYKDTLGRTQIGDFTDYTRGLEDMAMQEVIRGDENLEMKYELFKTKIANNLQNKYELSTGKEDINRMFLQSLRTTEDDTLYKNTAKAYHAKRKELVESRKEEFYRNKSLEEHFKLVDGEAELDLPEPTTDEEIKKQKEFKKLVAEFKNKVIYVNKKIHGVYDKNGAAQIEKEWWGSLLMQYHKHLPTGIFKHWRRRGYYSEIRGTRERGMYQTLIDFLSIEFNNPAFNKDEGTTILASLQNVMKATINIRTNATFNWNNLSRWEQANMKRNLSELGSCLAACLITLALFAIWDDDEIKDSKWLSSLLYLADRLYNDSSMYNVMGLGSEFKTTWSSPIASANGPTDFYKALIMIPEMIFDPEWSSTYKTGIHAGENKFMVMLKGNMPGVRPWDRIQNITKNNKHYKIGATHIGINASKNFGELIHD